MVMRYWIMNWGILVFIFLPFFVVDIAGIVAVAILTLVVVISIFITKISAVSYTVKYECHAFE